MSGLCYHKSSLESLSESRDEGREEGTAVALQWQNGSQCPLQCLRGVLLLGRRGWEGRRSGGQCDFRGRLLASIMGRTSGAESELYLGPGRARSLPGREARFGLVHLE